MARTGESYQQALTRIRDERVERAPARDVDLVAIEYFGVPVMLATFVIAGHLACVVSSRHLAGPFPRSPLMGLAARAHRTVH